MIYIRNKKSLFTNLLFVLLTTSPALLYLNWFGDWSYDAYYQVGKSFTNLEKSDYMTLDNFQIQNHIDPNNNVLVIGLNS
jgi:hypothetical protein